MPPCTAPFACTDAQVRALQTKPAVVTIAISGHQFVGNRIGIARAQPSDGKQHQAAAEGFDLACVHGAALGPAPTVRVKGRIICSLGVQGFCDCDSCDFCDSCRNSCFICRNCRRCRSRKSSETAFSHQVGQPHTDASTINAGLICTSFFLPSCIRRTRPSSSSSFTASANAVLSRSPPGPHRWTSRVGTLLVRSRRQ